MKEIERKFLVSGDSYRKESTRSLHIIQGFLNSHPERTVRVRISGEEAFMTVKGISNPAGTVRNEWEWPIPVQEARELLLICETPPLEKIRYCVPFGNHLFEIDEFLGSNQGLVLAEVELQYEEEHFPKPAWLGREVSGEVAYYNSQLTLNPFVQWKN